MSTSKDYMDFLLDQLSVLEGITYRRMMGEYLLYYRKKVAAYICDDRFFKRSFLFFLFRHVKAAVCVRLVSALTPNHSAGSVLLCILIRFRRGRCIRCGRVLPL